jgi:putative transposase
MVAGELQGSLRVGLANPAAALPTGGSRAGTRRGPKIAFPKFKGKRSVLSVRFTTGAFGLPDQDRRHVRLPRIGLVRTHESTRKLARRVDAGTARIRSVTVSYRRGRWHASFCVEADLADRVPAARGHRGCGCGDRAPGGGCPPARSSESAAAGRELSETCGSWAAGPAAPGRTRTGQQPSRRWRKTRRSSPGGTPAPRSCGTNALHRRTTRLATAYGTVVVEDLHVAGMLRNRRLARHLADAGFGQIRRLLGYKTAWHGGRLVTADRFYPSSKTCSGCGAMKAKLRLSERMFRCERCGLVMDRDLNAARNLAALAGGASSPSRGATINEPTGNPEKTRAAGTGYRHGKTIPATRDGQRPSRKARAA